jgi:hypothetical protein
VRYQEMGARWAWIILLTIWAVALTYILIFGVK